MNLATPPESAPIATPTFWSRFQETFGPALIGFLGGSLTLGIIYPSVSMVFTNASHTYAEFPSQQQPWLLHDISVPTLILVLTVLVGILAPFAMGLATAWLVRHKDRWSQVSAGLTTGFTSSVAAYLVGIGWMSTIALVTVPSIADLTLLGNATKTPTDQVSAPSEVLAEQYPDLKDKPADTRGGLLFTKIVADQIAGSVYGVWLGVVISLVSVGAIGFCGTLTGCWLIRRGGSWKSFLVPYFEITVAVTFTLGKLVDIFILRRHIDYASGSTNHEPFTYLWLVGMLGITAVLVRGVVGRWHWTVRLSTTIVWGLLFVSAGYNYSPAPAFIYAATLAGGVLVFVIGRRWFLTQQNLSSSTLTQSA